LAHHIDNNYLIIVVKTAHELQVSASVSLPINDRAPVAHLAENPNKLPSSPDMGSTESGKNLLVICLSHVFSAFAYD